MVNSRRRNICWGDLDMVNLELDKLILHFEHSNKAEGKSPKTISWYTEMLSSFTRFLISTGKNPILSEFNISTVREYIIHEQEKNLSPYTIQGKVRALKAFASWLLNEGYTEDHLLKNLKIPKAPKNLIEPLTQDEIDSLIKYQNTLSLLGCRNIAILILLLDSGIRVSELCGLHTYDTHIEDGYIKVMGKGAKERVVPIGGLSQKILWRYVIHFRPDDSLEADDRVFLAINGKPLRPNAVKLLLKRWGKNAGVDRLHAHLCRHTFATNFLIHKCGDVFRLQQILGHTSLEMVRKYVHYASTQEMINGRPSSPLDHMGIQGLRGYKIDQELRKNRNESANGNPLDHDMKSRSRRNGWYK